MATTARQILEDKGRETLSVSPQDTVLAAVRTMCERRVGALLVCEGEAEPIGIFTERDLMKRVILAERDPNATRVSEVMTPKVVAVGPSTSVTEAMAIMTECRCRHLPVVDGGKVVGLLSIGDLVRHASREQAFELRLLTDYVSGAVG